MNDRTGLSRGDRNRNARLARLRRLFPLENAIVGLDLVDDTQAVVVTDHDSRVIARRLVTAPAWELGGLLDWAQAAAAAAGFGSVAVACEATGHRWRVLDQLAAERMNDALILPPTLAPSGSSTAPKPTVPSLPLGPTPPLPAARSIPSPTTWLGCGWPLPKT